MNITEQKFTEILLAVVVVGVRIQEHTLNILINNPWLGY